MAADVTAFSNLESLLLFQSVAAYGNTADAFARISNSLRSSPLLQRQADANTERLNPDALTGLYLQLLKAEAKRAVNEASVKSSNKPAVSDATISESTQANGIPSPQLSTIEDAAAHRHLEPQMIDRLYTLYKDQVIQEIKEEETRYDQLVQEVKDLESQSPASSSIDNSQADHESPVVEPTPTAVTLSATNQLAKDESIGAVRSDAQLQQNKQAIATTSSPVKAEPRFPDPSEPTTKHNDKNQEPTNANDPSVYRSKSGGIRDYLLPAAAEKAIQKQQSTSHHVHQSNIPTQSQSSLTKRTGGMQLPPFQVSPQIPLLAQQQLQKNSISEPSTSKAATPGTQTPSSIKSSKAPVASLLQEGQGVHYSPGSSTGWKVTPGMPDAETPRPRSISPLSERDSSPERASKRRKTRGSAHESKPSKSAAKAPSQTPSMPATSSRGRTRSHSVTSQVEASPQSATLHPPTTRSTRATRNTPVPTAATAASPTTATTSKPSTKRKRASPHEPETSNPPSPLPIDTEQASPHPKRLKTDHDTDADHPTTIRASRNFHKASAPILNNIGSHKHASLFSQPVSSRTKGYYDIIKRPTDLSTIRKAIAAGAKAVNAAVSSAAIAAATGPNGPTTQGSPLSTFPPLSTSDGPPPTPGGTTTAGDSAHTVVLPLSRDLMPPDGIVNGAQLEQEITRMFANAVMFNEGDDGVVADAREMFAEVEGSIAAWKDAQRSSE